MPCAKNLRLIKSDPRVYKQTKYLSRWISNFNVDRLLGKKRASFSVFRRCWIGLIIVAVLLSILWSRVHRNGLSAAYSDAVLVVGMSLQAAKLVCGTNPGCRNKGAQEANGLPILPLFQSEKAMNRRRAELAVIPELLRFAVVGAVGFLVNTIAVTAASCVVDLYTTGQLAGWLR